MFLFQKVKFFIRYFFFLLGILDIISVVAAFTDLKMSLGFLECFDLSLSVYNSNIVRFGKFRLSSTLKKVFKYFWHSSFHLILAQNLARFDCLFSD